MGISQPPPSVPEAPGWASTLSNDESSLYRPPPPDWLITGTDQKKVSSAPPGRHVASEGERDGTAGDMAGPRPGGKQEEGIVEKSSGVQNTQQQQKRAQETRLKNIED